MQYCALFLFDLLHRKSGAEICAWIVDLLRLLQWSVAHRNHRWLLLARSQFHKLPSFPNVTSPQYSRKGLYSWSGKTLVVYGRDPTAPARGQFPTYVLATTDDGDTWVDWVLPINSQ